MQARAITQDYIISKLDELPSLPTIVYELSRTINDPMSSTTEVERIMSGDQSLTTKVLRLVNSSYYAIPGGVSSLGRAIAFIGFDTVHQLVLATSIIDALQVKGPQKFNIYEFWKHCIGAAIAAETIAKFIRHPTPSDLFVCGLVHDMGKVAHYTVDSDSMVRLVESAAAYNMSYAEAETKLNFPKHTMIGYQLSQRWNLPVMIQVCIKYHHTKEFNHRVGLTSEQHQYIDIVYLANLLMHAVKFGNSGHSKILGAPTELLQRLTIDPEKDFKRLLIEIKAAMEKATDFLRILGGGS